MANAIQGELALTQTSFETISEYLNNKLASLLQARGFTQALTCSKAIIADLNLKLSDLEKIFTDLNATWQQELRGQAQKKQAFEHTGTMPSLAVNVHGGSNTNHLAGRTPNIQLDLQNNTRKPENPHLMSLGLNSHVQNRNMMQNPLFSNLHADDSDNDDDDDQNCKTAESISLLAAQQSRPIQSNSMTMAYPNTPAYSSSPALLHNQNINQGFRQATHYNGPGSNQSFNNNATSGFSNYLHHTQPQQHISQNSNQMQMQLVETESRAELFSELLKMEEESSMEQQAALMKRKDASRTAYLQERNEAVDQIRTRVEEVATMYKRFNELVHIQEEMLIRIDNNVEEVVVNLDEGHFEMVKYLDSLSSNSWLIIKIFGIFLIFSILFVTILK